MIFSANSVRLSILCIICYRQRESIVTCEIVLIPMNSWSIVYTNLHKVFYHSIIVFVHLILFLFLTFVSCLLTVTLHIVDVRLTCLINITYLLTSSSMICSGSSCWGCREMRESDETRCRRRYHRWFSSKWNRPKHRRTESALFNEPSSRPYNWVFTRSDRRSDPGYVRLSVRPVGQTVAEPPTSVNQINVAC